MLRYLLLAVLTVTHHVLAALIPSINVLTVLLPTSGFMVLTSVLKLAVMGNLLTLSLKNVFSVPLDVYLALLLAHALFVLLLLVFSTTFKELSAILFVCQVIRLLILQLIMYLSVCLVEEIVLLVKELPLFVPHAREVKL